MDTGMGGTRLENDDRRLAEAIAGTMVALAGRLHEWLIRPETQAAMDGFRTWSRGVVEGANRLVKIQADRYVDAINNEKHRTLAAIERMPNGVHKADVPGLLTLGAPKALIARAEAGGPSRPKVHIYKPPIERFFIRLSAFDRLMRGGQTLDPRQRRRDFDLLPHRDRWVHALVCGEMQIARAEGLKGADARARADSEVSKALSLHAVKSMRHLSPTAVRRTYRQVEALAEGDREGIVLPPLTAEAFRAWMVDGRLPSWLED